MNKSTKLYCSIKSLLTDANKILEPINDIQNKDYNEMVTSAKQRNESKCSIDFSNERCVSNE